MPIADSAARLSGIVSSPVFYVVLGLGIAASLGVQGWQFSRFMTELQAQEDSASVEVAARPRRPRIQAREISGWNLMGAVEVEGEEAAPVLGDNVPETNLRYSLRGTFSAENPEASSAIIETSGGEAKFFVVGDPVGSGATLHSVYGDHVIFSRGGRLESLSFPDPDALASSGLKAHAGAGQAQQYKREQMQQQLDEIRRKLKLRQQGR